MNAKHARHSKGVKVITLVLAFVLVIGASISGTLAWLTAKTGEVKNTFTSAELFGSEGGLTLTEQKASANSDGTYTLTSETTTNGNAYNILPGVDIPKDPMVSVTNLEESAYLYIKVTENLPSGLTYEIDSRYWAVLDNTNYPGIYVYKGASAANNVISASDSNMKTFTAPILAGNKITVAGTYDGTSDDLSLAFEAYMVQATGNGTNAATAWTNTYGAPSGS